MEAVILVKPAPTLKALAHAALAVLGTNKVDPFALTSTNVPMVDTTVTLWPRARTCYQDSSVAPAPLATLELELPFLLALISMNAILPLTIATTLVNTATTLLVPTSVKLVPPATNQFKAISLAPATISMNA